MNGANYSNVSILPDPVPLPSQAQTIISAEAYIALQQIKSAIQAMKSPWLTREQAADYLHVHASEFDKMVKKGFVEKKYLGKALRFHRTQLDALISANKVDFRDPKTVGKYLAETHKEAGE